MAISIGGDLFPEAWNSPELLVINDRCLVRMPPAKLN
jgi:hypothetical protein